MAGFSNYLEQQLINHTLRGIAYASPATVYVALSTADPGEAGAGLAEPAGAWYGRVAGTFDAAGANSGIIDFGAVTVDNNGLIVTHFSIMDAAAAGNMLYFGPLAAAKTLNTDDAVSFPVGSLSVTLD